MDTDLWALWDAQIKLARGCSDGIADWIISFEDTEFGPALRYRAPGKVRLFLAQMKVFLAIRNDDRVTDEMIEEVIGAAAEARMENPE